MQTYLEAISDISPAPSRQVTYLKVLFEGVPLAGRRVLDVGGGSGLISFFAAAQGASSVVCLDPAGAGSNPAMDRQYELLEDRVGGPVTKLRKRFQDLDPDDRVYDVILVHNAVNHLDEDACSRLPARDARASYLSIFSSLHSLLATGGQMVVADCARRNLWGDLHLPNKFAPTIEWDIHQQPKMWDALMVDAGFRPGRVRWDAPSKLRRPGQILLGNGLGAYVTSSHFIITSQV